MKILLTLFILIFQIWSCSSTDSNDNILAPGDDSSQTDSKNTDNKRPTYEHINTKEEVGTFEDSRDGTMRVLLHNDGPEFSYVSAESAHHAHCAQNIFE